MSYEKLIVSIFAQDRPGIVRQLSDVVLKHEGNWLESSLTRLCGQFAGIVHIAVDANHKTALVSALSQLSEVGIQVTQQSNDGYQAEGDDINVIEVLVEANDRPGIVDEIASTLSQVNVNVEHMETECESASMAGYQLFKAHLMVSLPDGFSDGELVQALEGVSDDLTVSINDD